MLPTSPQRLFKHVSNSNYGKFTVFDPKCPYLEISPQTPKFKKKSTFLFLQELPHQYASNEPSMAIIAYVALEIRPIVQKVKLCSVGHSWVTPEIQFRLQVLRTP